MSLLHSDLIQVYFVLDFPILKREQRINETPMMIIFIIRSRYQWLLLYAWFQSWFIIQW